MEIFLPVLLTGRRVIIDINIFIQFWKYILNMYNEKAGVNKIL